MAFYIIYISCLVLLTGAPIITIGAAITAAYKCFFTLKENGDSMLIKDITKCYFKTFIKKMPYTSILLIWFIAIIFMVIKLPSIIHLNFGILFIMFLLCFEFILFFQIVFIIYAKDDSIKYFDLIIKSFFTIHINLFTAILMVLIQAILFGVVYLLPITIVICVGLYIYLNTIIYSNKIKVIIKSS